MLVLADTDGFGIDFDQLGQGILEPAGDGDGGAFLYRQIWKFMTGQFGGGVDRSPAFIDNDIAHPGKILQDFCHKTF